MGKIGDNWNVITVTIAFHVNIILLLKKITGMIGL